MADTSRDPYPPLEARKNGMQDRPPVREVEKLVDTIIASSLVEDKD